MRRFSATTKTVDRQWWAVGALTCAFAAAILTGCQQSPSSSVTSGRSEPKAEYREAIAAAEKLGLEVRADERGEVTYMDFYAVRDIPAAVVYIKEFPHVKLLNFSGTNLSDAEMVHLEGAEQLEELGLHGTNVTDAGLVHIAGLTNLRVLNLNDTEVGDEGLQHLAGLTNLEQLRLQSTNVTDDGLASIAPLKKLQVVWLSGSEVTAEGTDRLKESLPQADVINTEIAEPSGEPLLPAPGFEQ